jgi:hypothetical protein
MFKRFLLALLFLATPLSAELKHSLDEIQKATESFLESLDEAHREKATFAFTDKERENWHFTPMVRQGVPLKELNDAQKNAAIGIITALLSDKGAYRAAQVVVAEGVLAVMEKNPEFRDVENYYMAVFGKPGDPKAWGFRFEGHHLSLNFSVIDGDKYSLTPSFMGANPAEVRVGEHKGLRPLAAEEDLARALMLSLRATGKEKVIFSEKPPKDILTAEKSKVEPLDAVGVSLDDLTEAQKEALFELITEFTHRYRPELADSELKAIRDAGKIHFGWAGSIKPREAYYYRIQGPSFLIETANTQNDANHVHTVWRDFDGDFGRDLLREHFEEAH